MPINDKTPRPQEFAAVDLGSNSFHMVIAREVDGALQIIGRLKQRVHLADGLDERSMLSEEAMERLRPFGRIAMNGQFLGYPSDFVAHGAFSTPLGQISSDINFKINEEDIDGTLQRGAPVSAAALLRTTSRIVNSIVRIP